MLSHLGTGICFRHGIKVAINICGGTHATMPEPFVNLLHGHALSDQDRCAKVAQAVEGYLLQVMLLRQLPEVSDDEGGIVQLAEGIHTGVVGVPLSTPSESPFSFALASRGT